MNIKLLSIFLALGGICAGAYPDKPCVTIHPTPYASNNETETGPFLNGVTFKCPDGMKIVDAKHLFRASGMTYQEVFNATAQAECR